MYIALHIKDLNEMSMCVYYEFLIESDRIGVRGINHLPLAVMLSEPKKINK